MLLFKSVYLLIQITTYAKVVLFKRSYAIYEQTVFFSQNEICTSKIFGNYVCEKKLR